MHSGGSQGTCVASPQPPVGRLWVGCWDLAPAWGRGSSDPATYTLCNLREGEKVVALSGPLSLPVKQVPIVSHMPAPLPSLPWVRRVHIHFTDEELGLREILGDRSKVTTHFAEGDIAQKDAWRS